MKIDTFLFNSELDMLELRLNILDPVMDRFVLVESTLTHSGKEKPLYFAENKERFSPWKDKITHHIVTDMPSPTPNRWVPENHQRNAIMTALGKCKANDLIFLSDIDEIPDPDPVRKNKCGGYRQTYSMYYANTIHLSENWVGTVAQYYFHYQQSGMQQVRNNRYNYQIVNPGGWHFSYMMTAEQIHNKLRAFAHGEWDNPEIHSLVEKRMEKLDDLFGAHNQPLTVFDIDTGYFPQYLKDNKEKYAKYLHNA
jgi:beta-1,4-mannosyl-glycoprotein beta-1,4-N-acetylglucosaminyltransferase